MAGSRSLLPLVEAVLAIPGVAVQAGIVDPKNEVALDAIVFDTLTAISKGKK